MNALTALTVPNTVATIYMFSVIAPTFNTKNVNQLAAKLIIKKTMEYKTLFMLKPPLPNGDV